MKLNKEYIKIQDIILLAAMGPPGGGRNHITERMTRHFNVIAYAELNSESIKNIFGQIVGHFLARFKEDVRFMIPKIIEASLDLYNEAK